jgi:hypothetical protein
LFYEPNVNALVSPEAAFGVFGVASLGLIVSSAIYPLPTLLLSSVVLAGFKQYVDSVSPPDLGAVPMVWRPPERVTSVTLWTTQTCLVTGANSGIGLAVATELAAQGHTVILACRSQEKCDAAAAEIVHSTDGSVRREQLVPVGEWCAHVGVASGG